MMTNCFDYKAADRQYFGGRLGADCTPERTAFRVWQPFAENVDLRLYNANNVLIFSAPMEKKNGVFEYEKTGDLDGVFYAFSVTRNGETVESADPYSAAVTADGGRGQIVDMRRHAPEGWESERNISVENPIIYELSVRDFSMDESADFASRGKFHAFCEENVKNSHGDIVGLDYIKKLGITHLQLMPIFDFDLDGGEYNWGYNPRFYNAPSVHYSRSDGVRELRELVSAVHKRGLGVIMDVVYNHVFSVDDSSFGRIFPRYYFRGKYDYSNGSGCGNEFASERKMARRFILDSLEFLAREYKLDGFRFDLMGLLDIGTLREAERRLRKINPDLLLYGEGWVGGASPYPERFRAVLGNAKKLQRFAFFNDRFRDGVKGSVFRDEDTGYVNGAADEWHFAPIKWALSGEFPNDFWTDDSSQSINYVECHDNLTLFDKLNISLDGADRERVAGADKMAAALVFLSRGIPFIQAGQEFLRTKNGIGNSYNFPDRVNSLKWDDVTENRDIVEYYRGLIAFRKRFFGNFGECFFEDLDGGVIMKTGCFLLIINPTSEKIIANIDGDFEIFADENRAADKPLYTNKRLCCAEFSILLARRIQMKQMDELRGLMRERGIYAYIVPTDDFHGSEYVGAHFKLREYLSGFTGSAGTLVVTLNEAVLWTDGRYFIQAERELSGSGIELMRMGEPQTPAIECFLLDKMPEKSSLGFDGRVVSAAFAMRLGKVLQPKNITLKTDEDLGGMVWKCRPPLSRQYVFELSESVCGVSRNEKLTLIREKMKSENADCLAVSALDEIAWALNLRGNDVDYNPVFLSFMLVYADRVELFAERSIFSDRIVRKLQSDGVEILPYEEIYDALKSRSGAVYADLKEINYCMKSSLEHARIISKQSPIVMMKAVKNTAEIAAEKSAHIKDGVAVTRFMYWLKHAIGHEKITEISAAEKLEEFRGMGEGYLGQSFEPIMAFGEHGAIVHYSATEEINAELLPSGLLLSDTGGHYLDGTTDITRTFVLGEVTDEEKRAFTLVLAAHLELLGAVFPKGVRGSTLDGIARHSLWRHGLDFNHGTGHGVGFLLNVHEGPQRISWRAVNDAPLEAGMIISDEPGLYFEEKFGIRHESLLLCQEAEWLNDGFLCFSPLTCVPFDTKGIDRKLLTDEQITYFNEYQNWVCETLSPLLPKEEAEWLTEITKPI